jgi:DNA-binding NtrC family response regulator
MDRVSFVPPSERRLALLAAQSESTPVLIHGANGTGREGLALWIHAHSARAALKPISLKNSKTSEGVSSPRMDLVEAIRKGHGNTLLLNEVSDWSLEDQEILSSYLKTRTLVTSGVPELLQTRIIATTRYDLGARVQAGLFSAQLLDRLSTFVLHTPALHQRQDELEEIVLEILSEIGREHHLEHIRGLSREAWQKIKSHTWPGNIRELRNALRLATVRCKIHEIQVEDLPPLDGLALEEGSPLLAARDDFDRALMKEILDSVGWDLSTAAGLLKISPHQLSERLKKSGLQAEA